MRWEIQGRKNEMPGEATSQIQKPDPGKDIPDHREKAEAKSNARETDRQHEEKCQTSTRYDQEKHNLNIANEQTTRDSNNNIHI